jgi:ABC-type sugar transport system substrate-binding protein
MADAAEALIALQPNGDSNGTQDMIERAKKRGIPVFVYPPPLFDKQDGEYVYTF